MNKHLHLLSQSINHKLKLIIQITMLWEFLFKVIKSKGRAFSNKHQLIKLDKQLVLVYSHFRLSFQVKEKDGDQYGILLKDTQKDKYT